MDERDASRVWTQFEEVAPNLCYISRVRKLLGDLAAEAGTPDDLLSRLDRAIPAEENPSLRTDLKILMERLQKVRNASPKEG
jgi:hypothetical protein